MYKITIKYRTDINQSYSYNVQSDVSAMAALLNVLHDDFVKEFKISFVKEFKTSKPKVKKWAV